MSKKRNTHTSLQQHETTTIKKRDKENVKRIKKAGMIKRIPAMSLSENKYAHASPVPLLNGAMVRPCWLGI